MTNTIWPGTMQALDLDGILTLGEAQIVGEELIRLCRDGAYTHAMHADAMRRLIDRVYAIAAGQGVTTRGRGVGVMAMRERTRRAMAGNPALLAELERDWARQDTLETQPDAQSRVSAMPPLSAMRPGDVRYTTWWAMWQDADGRYWLHPEFPAAAEPFGTRNMRVELRDDGYHARPRAGTAYKPRSWRAGGELPVHPDAPGD